MQAQAQERIVELINQHSPESLIDEARLPVKRLHLAESQKLMEHLTIFYTHHYAATPARLILLFHAWGDCRMINQGWQLQDVAST
jgi:hypothetical protein